MRNLQAPCHPGQEYCRGRQSAPPRSLPSAAFAAFLVSARPAATHARRMGALEGTVLLRLHTESSAVANPAHRCSTVSVEAVGPEIFSRMSRCHACVLKPHSALLSCRRWMGRTRHSSGHGFSKRTRLRSLRSPCALLRRSRSRSHPHVLHTAIGRARCDRGRCRCGWLAATLARRQVTRSICIELFSDVKNLGRFLLRDRDTTIVAGIVTRIIT